MAALRTTHLFASGLLVLVALSGCQCCEVSEIYGDRIDRIADRQLTLDRFYRPGLDLTRICHDCNTQSPYYQHPVIYPESRISTRPAVEPTVPDVPPSEIPPLPELAPAPPADNADPSVEDAPIIPPGPAEARKLPSLRETSLKPIEAVPAAKPPASPAATATPKVVSQPKSSQEATSIQEVSLPPVSAFIGAIKTKQPEISQVSKSEAAVDEKPESLPKQMNVTPPKPIGPVSAPAGIKPSQKFYQHQNR
ncbi:hypothetical protein [Thalassoglobus polymorphus]|nr:hypothetical protein [Thalassoglobus polymorphus]